VRIVIDGFVGVVESVLFISRAEAIFVADTTGVHRFDIARAPSIRQPVDSNFDTIA
jgi:hypothetical protein